MRDTRTRGVRKWSLTLEALQSRYILPPAHLLKLEQETPPAVQSYERRSSSGDASVGAAVAPRTRAAIAIKIVVFMVPYLKRVRWVCVAKDELNAALLWFNV